MRTALNTKVTGRITINLGKGGSCLLMEMCMKEVRLTRSMNEGDGYGKDKFN